LCLARGIDLEAINMHCFIAYFGPPSSAAIWIEQVHATGANAGCADQPYRSIHHPPP
jgi:hypothetical protein